MKKPKLSLTNIPTARQQDIYLSELYNNIPKATHPPGRSRHSKISSTASPASGPSTVSRNMLAEFRRPSVTVQCRDIAAPGVEFDINLNYSYAHTAGYKIYKITSKEYNDRNFKRTADKAVRSFSIISDPAVATADTTVSITFDRQGYYASAGIIPKKKGSQLSYLILCPLVKQQKQAVHLRLIIFLADLAAISLLIPFFWFFTRRMLTPLEKAAKNRCILLRLLPMNSARHSPLLASAWMF